MAKLGPSFADQIIAELLCPGCQGFLLPPILQCVNGHTMCSSCRDKRNRCSVCQEGFTNVRCRPLELLAEHYQLYCTNGCGQKLRLVKVQEHETICPNRQFICKVGKCQWRGILSELAGHVSRKHPGDIFMLGQTHIQLKWEGHYVKLVVLGAETLFWYHLIQDHSKQKVLRAFEYIGPASEANRYVYSFSITLPDSPTVISIKRPAYSCHDDMIDVFEKDTDFSDILACVMKRYKKETRIPCVTSIGRVKNP